MKVTIVAGARPNFMKVAPIIKAIHHTNHSYNITYRLVHTGQHYDKKMSDDFFKELGIPDPDVNFNVGSGSQAEQTGTIMMKFEKELHEYRPDVVLVVGDVTSTMACAIAAKKLCIDVVHVEAGIRSGDMSMPEEVNRIVTDSISDQFFTTSEVANDLLLKSGISEDKVHFVGNTMIDTLYQNIHRLKPPDIWAEKKLKSGNYFLLTLHRPSNVDEVSNLKKILDVIIESAGNLPVVFPVHPRTRRVLDLIKYIDQRLIQVSPLSYLEFIFLVKNTKAVITDSGGITEEATVLKVPCMTLRNSTERPETITMGTNVLVGTDPTNLVPYFNKLQNNQWKPSGVPPLWDGKTSDRIVEILIRLYIEKGGKADHCKLVAV